MHSAEPGDYVCVVWIDSGLHSDFGWGSTAEYMKKADASDMTVQTVGIYMDETDEVVSVALNWDESHDTWLGAQLIYKENIVEFHRLEKVTK